MNDVAPATVAAAVTAPENVHVFTDAQLQELISKVTPGPGVVHKVGSAIHTGASDVVAGVEKAGSKVKSVFRIDVLALVLAIVALVNEYGALILSHIK